MRGVTATLMGALVALALTASVAAGAVTPVGSTTLVVGAAQSQLLDKRGVDIGGAGAAESNGREIRLGISGGSIGNTADLTSDGALRLAAGSGRARKVVRLTGLRVALASASTLSAKLGGKRRTVFDLKTTPGSLTIDSARGTAQLQKTQLVWRRGAARALSNRLGVRIPRGVLGTIKVNAAVVIPDTPQQGAISDEPPLLARPASAVNVTAATLSWHVRDSWIRYANTQEAPQASEGAVAAPAAPESTHPCPDRPADTNPTLVYSYGFPFANGWYDPVSGSAALYYLGAVRFSYPAHGIDLTTRNPEIEINGAASRAIFRLRSDVYPDKRAAILGLASSGAPSEGPAGSFGFPTPLRGSLTPDGQAVFAGFYAPPNNGFGCFSVSFSTG